MPNQNPDADAVLRKLGHHVRLGWKKSDPTSDKALESIRNVIRQKWEQEEKAKTGDNEVRFQCPMCSQKLIADFNDLVKDFKTSRSSAFGTTTCPSCQHLIKLPRSLVARVRRNVLLTEQPKRTSRNKRRH